MSGLRQLHLTQQWHNLRNIGPIYGILQYVCSLRNQFFKKCSLIARKNYFNQKKSFSRHIDTLSRLLRDSHLDLEIETLKENSHLILNLDSQFCCEYSHSHSQLSFSNSQKFETSRLNLVDFSGNFSNISL